MRSSKNFGIFEIEMDLTAAFWINALILIGTIVAIIYGPIKAVDITRKRDLERDAELRKRQILSTLMRTRKMVVHPDHVGALNQIQLEFFNNGPVIAAYRSYIANLSETVPKPGNDLQNFLTRRNDFFFDLLHAISVAAGVPLDRHELDRFAYVPFGWQSDENEIKVFRGALIEVLQGRKSLHVTSAAPTAQAPNNPFPPPP
jgi:hypothetical protein